MEEDKEEDGMELLLNTLKDGEDAQPTKVMVVLSQTALW